MVIHDYVILCQAHDFYFMAKADNAWILSILYDLSWHIQRHYSLICPIFLSQLFVMLRHLCHVGFSLFLF